MNWRAWWEKVTGVPDEAVGDAQTGAGLQPESEIGQVVRWAAYVLLGGFLLFLLWALLAPLDSGVPAQGVVMVDTKRKTIQHLTGGLIEKVAVREGQEVNAGDLLIKLDDTQAHAEYETVRQRYLGLRTEEDRLMAEQASKSEITFHPDVLASRNDPLINQHMLAQERLLASRRLALSSEIGAITESIRSQEEAAKGFAAQLESRKAQATFINEEREGLRELVKEGYAPRNKLLEVERLAADIDATTSDLRANLARARRSVAELSLRKIQREQEYSKEVGAQLAEVRRQVTADEERFKAAQEALDRTEIRAPVGGSVIGIATQTVGGVIPPATRIMDVVPRDEALMLEAHIPPHLIDRVKVGQPADIRFSNFAQTPQLVVEGKLVSISADLLTDQATNMSYYLGRIAVTPDGLKTLGSHRLQPGMPVEIVIKTGERSLFEYLIHPLTRRLAQAMKEE